MKLILGWEQTGVDHQQVYSVFTDVFIQTLRFRRDPETRSKDLDEEERGCPSGLRGEICPANHSDVYIQVYWRSKIL